LDYPYFRIPLFVSQTLAEIIQSILQYFVKVGSIAIRTSVPVKMCHVSETQRQSYSVGKRKTSTSKRSRFNV